MTRMQRMIQVRLYVVVVAGLVALTSLPLRSTAQTGSSKTAAVSARFVYHRWKLSSGDDKTTVSQAGFPINGMIPLRHRFDFRFYTAASTNKVASATSDLSLSGTADVRFQINRSFFEEQLVIGLGMNLPTGKTRLDFEQDTTIINFLSQNFLNFSMRRFGQGFGVNVLLGGAALVGPVHTGAGLVYNYAGSYNPYESTGRYDPGNSLRTYVNGDWKAGRYGLSGRVAYTYYTPDRFEGNRTFKQAQQLELLVTAAHWQRRYQAFVSLFALVRDRNAVYDNAADTVSRQLRLYGNQFAGTVGVRWAIAHNWHLTPTGEIKLIGDNEDGLGGSTVFGLGATVGRRLGQHLRANVGTRYYFGEADSGAIDIGGLMFAGSVTTSF